MPTKHPNAHHIPLRLVFESPVHAVDNLMHFLGRTGLDVKIQGHHGAEVPHVDVGRLALDAKSNRVRLFQDVIRQEIAAKEKKLLAAAGVKNMAAIMKNPQLRQRFSADITHLDSLQAELAGINSTIKGLDKQLAAMSKSESAKSLHRN
ncbi:MAG TPA: hypothetical protein VJG83_04710 [archaeon]|nr:hypothetical protein [archaeon]